MDLILNDLSIHGQFGHPGLFHEALKRVMHLRDMAHGYDREIYIRQVDVMRCINSGSTVFEAIHKFTQDEKRAFLGWMSHQGPFWDNGVEIPSTSWFEHQGDNVTESALAFAACGVEVGVDRRLVSLHPSDWEVSPIIVTRRSDADSSEISVDNYWQSSDLEIALQEIEPPLESWIQLENTARQRLQQITFTSDCFKDLAGRPFAQSAAKRILERLVVLNQLMEFTDDDGRRTPKGQQLFQDHFVGKQAHFSDSSDSEKQQFQKQLSFPIPDSPGQLELCSFHGKVKKPPYRIHFNWPVPPGGRLYVVYVGWKRTTR